MAKTPAIASTLVSKLKDSWQHLLRDRAARALTFNDEQFHLLEKLKMKETAKSLECLLGCCSTTLHTSAEGLADWCKGAHVQRLQVDIAQSDLQRHGEQLQQLQARLAATQDAYHAQANRLLNALQDSSIALQGGPTAATISQSPSGAAEDSLGAHVLAADEAADIKLRSKRKHKPSHHSSSSGHRAAVVRNLERVSEKQEATLRLLEEARTLNNMVRQTVAFSQQQQQQ